MRKVPLIMSEKSLDIPARNVILSCLIISVFDGG